LIVDPEIVGIDKPQIVDKAARGIAQRLDRSSVMEQSPVLAAIAQNHLDWAVFRECGTNLIQRGLIARLALQETTVVAKNLRLHVARDALED